MDRQFGCLPSPVDERDYRAASYLPAGVTVYPESYRLHNLNTIKYDQGSTMKCVAYSTKQILEVMNRFDKDVYIPMSVDYIFSNRYPDQENYDLLPFEGSYPRDIIQSVQRGGACEDKHWPTIQPDTYQLWSDMQITADMRKNAEGFKIATYLRVSTTTEIKQALMTLKTPVLISIAVTDKFVGDYNEMITQEYAKANNQGYHAIIIVGWRTHNGREYWDCFNSWGSTWGNYNGEFYLPIGYPLVEAWSVTDQVLNHWASKYYDYLAKLGVELNEKGFDLPATRGKVFEYFAKVLGYKGEDIYDNYWNWINTHGLKIYSKDYDRNISRAETFALLARLKGIKEPVVYPKGVHWGESYWTYLNANGVKIYDKDYDRNVTRAEVMALLSRLKGFVEPSGK